VLLCLTFISQQYKISRLIKKKNFPKFVAALMKLNNNWYYACHNSFPFFLGRADSELIRRVNN
jgi:hypothetical protein